MTTDSAPPSPQGEELECGRCLGLGVLEIVDPDRLGLDGEHPVEGEDPCPDCEGTGKVPASPRGAGYCNWCRGMLTECQHATGICSAHQHGEDPNCKVCYPPAPHKQNFLRSGPDHPEERLPLYKPPAPHDTLREPTEAMVRAGFKAARSWGKVVGDLDGPPGMVFDVGEHPNEFIGEVLRAALAAQPAPTEGRMSDNLQEALQAAHHELTTIHGLWATDTLGAYGDALRSGCDPNSAWDCFREEMWRIDVQSVLDTIDRALAKHQVDWRQVVFDMLADDRLFGHEGVYRYEYWQKRIVTLMDAALAAQTGGDEALRDATPWDAIEATVKRYTSLSERNPVCVGCGRYLVEPPEAEDRETTECWTCDCPLSLLREALSSRPPGGAAK